ncbi:MAG: sigma-70 family RNA polymerase sigma factor [Candidatus Staskawiczbacteria bacterium]|jgi:RNA polymerase primary sigma factor
MIAATSKTVLTVGEQKAYDQIPKIVKFIPHSSFRRPSAMDSYFGSEAREIKIPKPRVTAVNVDGVKENHVFYTTLSAEDELELFFRYNYAKYVLRKLMAQQKRREAISWFQRAQRIRAIIIQANLGLVFAMTRRFRMKGVTFHELIAEGNFALVRSVEKFNAARGFKFSTYACNVIARSFMRIKRPWMQLEIDLTSDVGELERHNDDEAIYREIAQQILEGEINCLSEIEARVIILHFGLPLNGNKGKKTFREISAVIGLSRERARQIEEAGLKKMRTAMLDYP